MIEMMINLEMNEKNDITIKNEYTSKNLVIDYSKKTINAVEVYELLSYSDGEHYEVSSNYESIPDVNEKDYFYEIIAIIDSIKNELNALNDSDTTAENDNQNSEESIDNEITDVVFDDSDFSNIEFDDLPF